MHSGPGPWREWSRGWSMGRRAVALVGRTGRSRAPQRAPCSRMVVIRLRPPGGSAAGDVTSDTEAAFAPIRSRPDAERPTKRRQSGPLGRPVPPPSPRDGPGSVDRTPRRGALGPCSPLAAPAGAAGRTAATPSPHGPVVRPRPSSGAAGHAPVSPASRPFADGSVSPGRPEDKGMAVNLWPRLGVRRARHRWSWSHHPCLYGTSTDRPATLAGCGAEALRRRSRIATTG